MEILVFGLLPHIQIEFSNWSILTRMILLPIYKTQPESQLRKMISHHLNLKLEVRNQKVRKAKEKRKKSQNWMRKEFLLLNQRRLLLLRFQRKIEAISLHRNEIA